MIIGEREGTQFKIILTVLKKKKICLNLYNYFVSVKGLGILFLSLNESKNSQFFPSDPKIYLKQTTLARLHLSLLRLF